MSKIFSVSILAFAALIFAACKTAPYEERVHSLFSAFDLPSAHYGVFYDFNDWPTFAKFENGKYKLLAGEFLEEVSISFLDQDSHVVIIADQSIVWSELRGLLLELVAQGIDYCYIAISDPSNPRVTDKWVLVRDTDKPIHKTVTLSASEQGLSVSLYTGANLEAELVHRDIEKLHGYYWRTIPKAQRSKYYQAKVFVNDDVLLGDFISVYDYLLRSSSDPDFEIFVDFDKSHSP